MDTDRSVEWKVLRMKTPAGHECRHYYQDFHRGRDVQECRLQKANPASLTWTPGDCARCPVPAILLANASPNLELTLTLRHRFWMFGREAHVSARCSLHNLVLDDPYVGCPKCHDEKPGFEMFLKALEESERPSNPPPPENQG